MSGKAVSLAGVVDITGGDAILDTATIASLSATSVTLDTVTCKTSLDCPLLTQAGVAVATQDYVNSKLGTSSTFTTLSVGTLTMTSQIVFSAKTNTGLTMTGAPIDMGGGTLSLSGGTITGIGGTIDMGVTGKIINVNNPISPLDVANKAYIDAATSVIVSANRDVDLATATDFLGFTFDATTNFGTITSSANGALVIDSVTATKGMRVLIKDIQGSRKWNGIYTVSDPGSASTPFILARATDFNTDTQVVAGLQFRVRQGGVNAYSTWVNTTTLASGKLNVASIIFQAVGLMQGTLNGLTTIGALRWRTRVYNNVTVGFGVLPGPSCVENSDGFVDANSANTCFILTSSPTSQAWTAPLGTTSAGDTFIFVNGNAKGQASITVQTSGYSFVDGTGTSVPRIVFAPGQAAMFIDTGSAIVCLSGGYTPLGA